MQSCLVRAVLILGMSLGFGACGPVGLQEDGRARADSVTVLWSGAVTDTSARVAALVPEAAASVRLHVTPPGPAAPFTVSGTRRAPGAHRFHLEGLTPGATYAYALEVNGRVDTTRRGRVRTMQAGAHSFRVVASSCAQTGSNHPVFDAIRTAGTDLFLHLGDMHYEDIHRPRAAVYRAAIRAVHSAPRQAALYRTVPLAYMWDDHDYGPNNSSRRAPAQAVARRAYRALVPHYPTAVDSLGPIHQAFTIGRVRFLLTDLRSARSGNDLPDSPQKTMMGAAQKAWFKDQLAAARDPARLIVWVSSVPWIANNEDARDRWSGFATERRELATYIDSIGVNDRMVVLSGDAHMLALDDGTNNRYGRPDGGGFPVVQAAALDRTGSVKGGPYTHGPFPNGGALFGPNDGQFAVLDVDDDGGAQVCLRVTGRRLPFDEPETVDLFTWRRCFDVPTGAGASGAATPDTSQ